MNISGFTHDLGGRPTIPPESPPYSQFPAMITRFPTTFGVPTPPLIDMGSIFLTTAEVILSRGNSNCNGSQPMPCLSVPQYGERDYYGIDTLAPLGWLRLLSLLSPSFPPRTALAVLCCSSDRGIYTAPTQLGDTWRPRELPEQPEVPLVLKDGSQGLSCQWKTKRYLGVLDPPHRCCGPVLAATAAAGTTF
ncbi:Uncharacterized protein HZ326_6899 [Fusarium oxysporum f. sp. albedinis]|nr:Uncharacterized protein HZ326_6899 [Fusarium oxysporum f. sp. albedinis]